MPAASPAPSSPPAPSPAPRSWPKIVSEAQGPAALRHAIHPATRTFQALRIHVNDELGELERGLDAAHGDPEAAKAAWRWCRSTAWKTASSSSSSAAAQQRRAARLRAMRRIGAAARPAFKLITTRPRTPSADEIANNPRARSAKLRVGERLAA